MYELQNIKITKMKEENLLNWKYIFEFYLKITHTYLYTPKVLGRPLLMNRFVLNYFSNFYEYKS